MMECIKHHDYMNYLTLIIVAVVGIVAGYLLARLSVRRGNNKGTEKMNRVAREKKEDAKRKILALIESKGKVKNDNVQNLLGVSDATATNYLDELEEENKIIAKGVARGTFYILK